MHTPAVSVATTETETTPIYTRLAEEINSGTVAGLSALLTGIDINTPLIKSAFFEGLSVPRGLRTFAQGRIGIEWSETLLDLAIIKGNLGMVRLLLDKGAKLDLPSSHLRAPPLFLALSINNTSRHEIVNELLKRGANVKEILPLLIKEFGKNTLDIVPTAYCCINPTAFNMQLDGADNLIPIVLAKNLSVLHMAVLANVSPETLRLLLKYDADRDAEALFIARTTGEHCYQMYFTRTGILAMTLSIFSLCASHIVDHIAALCRPGIHVRMCMDSVTADIPKTPTDLARSFGRDELLTELERPRSAFLYGDAAGGAGAGAGAAKDGSDYHEFDY
jgi:hypothetical protein